jgi:hypothetical protein
VPKAYIGHLLVTGLWCFSGGRLGASHKTFAIADWRKKQNRWFRFAISRQVLLGSSPDKNWQMAHVHDKRSGDYVELIRWQIACWDYSERNGLCTGGPLCLSFCLTPWLTSALLDLTRSVSTWQQALPHVRPLRIRYACERRIRFISQWICVVCFFTP